MVGAATPPITACWGDASKAALGQAVACNPAAACRAESPAAALRQGTRKVVPPEGRPSKVPWAACLRSTDTHT